MKNTDDPLFRAILENVASTFHEPAGILKHPYLDPGGVYSKNLWDWDSFWTLTGLLGIAEKTNDPGLKREALKHGTGALRNFFDHQAPDGSIPILLTDQDADCFDYCTRTMIRRPGGNQRAGILELEHPGDTDVLIQGRGRIPSLFCLAVDSDRDLTSVSVYAISVEPLAK